MKDAILKLIQTRTHVSVVELCRGIPGFRGNMEWVSGTNTVLWPYVSEEAIEAIESLREDGKIVMVVCSPWVYITDGAMPDYPHVKSLNHDYQNPHWLPVTFSTPEQAEKDGAK